MEAYFKKMEQKFNEVGTNILQRITSPWFFTFIPWWVVFNYDFLLIMLDKIHVVYAINQHYCTVGSTRYTIAGCIPQISIGFWHWVFYTPWVTKLALPMITTIFSMTIFSYFISWIIDTHNTIMQRNSTKILFRELSKITEEMGELSRKYAKSNDDFNNIIRILKDTKAMGNVSVANSINFDQFLEFLKMNCESRLRNGISEYDKAQCNKQIEIIHELKNIINK